MLDLQFMVKISLYPLFLVVHITGDVKYEWLLEMVR